MKFKILSWNVERAFGHQYRCKKLVRKILRWLPDIAFFPEAYIDECHFINEAVFTEAGYTCVHVCYNDITTEPQPFFLLIYRDYLDIAVEIVYLDHRAAIVIGLCIDGKLLQIICLHLDDKSEEGRLAMLTALFSLSQEICNQDLPTLTMGDLNAMHSSDLQAQFLRSKAAAMLTSRIRNKRFVSLSSRLRQMAVGQVMQAFNNHGFSNVDRLHWPTMKPKRWLPLAVVQLDHVLHNKFVKVSWLRIVRSLLSDHDGLFYSIDSELIDAVPTTP